VEEKKKKLGLGQAPHSVTKTSEEMGKTDSGGSKGGRGKKEAAVTTNGRGRGTQALKVTRSTRKKEINATCFRAKSRNNR